jgi:hypothetical protein
MLLTIIGASLVLVLTAFSAGSSAYEGAFCYEEPRAEFAGCVSQSRSNIRRAIGHTKDAYSDVAIETGTESALGYCRSIECEANTGYLNKDGTGTGTIWNEGPNGERKVSGYLYP